MILHDGVIVHLIHCVMGTKHVCPTVTVTLSAWARLATDTMYTSVSPEVNLHRSLHDLKAQLPFASFAPVL